MCFDGVRGSLHLGIHQPFGWGGLGSEWVWPVIWLQRSVVYLIDSEKNVTEIVYVVLKFCST